MARPDAIVLGLGAMGSAAVHRLALRGLRVIGLEQHTAPHTLGSSSGESRVIRLAYFEDPRYVPLARRAYQLWQALEGEAGEGLLSPSGCLNIGPPDHEHIRGVLAASELHGLACERLDAAEMRRRFGALRVADADIGVYEEAAGILRPERCVAAQLAAAERLGVRLLQRERVVSVTATVDGVRVVSERDRYQAGALVVCAGPWLVDPDSPVRIEAPLHAERQVQLWFAPRRPELHAPGRLPVFIHFDGDRIFYGVPQVHEPGIKVCRHHAGARVLPSTVDRVVHPADVEDVREFLRRHLPDTDGEPVRSAVCMYTNTPDLNFLIGPHPTLPRVFVAGGFSGHGFKFAPVVGEILADLVSQGRTAYQVEHFDPRRFL